MMVGQFLPPNSRLVVSDLGIAADQQHALALLRHHVAEVGKREALARSALAVDRDDLRFLLHLARVDRIGFDRGFVAQGWSGYRASSSAFTPVQNHLEAFGIEQRCGISFVEHRQRA